MNRMSIVNVVKNCGLVLRDVAELVSSSLGNNNILVKHDILQNIEELQRSLVQFKQFVEQKK